MHNLTLLHYDSNFVTVNEVTGQPVEWVAEPGTVTDWLVTFLRCWGSSG